MDEKKSEKKFAAPFKCPLTRCEENISSSLLLSHFMKVHHHEDNGVDLKEIQEKEKISLIASINEENLQIDRVVCLGILAYRNDEKAEGGIARSTMKKHSNALLSKQHEFYETHLPILIMASRGNYVKMYASNNEFIDPQANFLTIWLLMPEIMETKLVATVTVYNEELTRSLSSLIYVRKANDTQNARDFMRTEMNCLTINSGFLEQISNEDRIFIEISIEENLL
ncbi:CLUMA_CG020235, isoform A [Clunio marinus]|uniref:CLUMA_CG020235, isoform A n=1 Tax=Clunio marinus TaxID=568069 RepID=A0A1J1J4D7_9DIPT|nr:CLUMA_CG020235, isoform A [Clunio marinus]